jgi:formate dehydrogenase subunit delta
MENEKMVHMANEIANYFQVYPEQRAQVGVRDHIRKYWPPNMREQLVAYRTGGGEGLHPLVNWAAENIPEAET